MHSTMRSSSFVATTTYSILLLTGVGHCVCDGGGGGGGGEEVDSLTGESLGLHHVYTPLLANTSGIAGKSQPALSEVGEIMPL